MITYNCTNCSNQIKTFAGLKILCKCGNRLYPLPEIKKKGLPRPCRRCEKKFQPYGVQNRLCINCREEVHKERCKKIAEVKMNNKYINEMDTRRTPKSTRNKGFPYRKSSGKDKTQGRGVSVRNGGKSE